jgi:hypothetical protein
MAHYQSHVMRGMPEDAGKPKNEFHSWLDPLLHQNVLYSGRIAAFVLLGSVSLKEQPHREQK